MWLIDRIFMRLLFVCVGNSCRSQMAEGLARSMGHFADSAGTHPSSTSIASNAKRYLESRGISSEGMAPKSVDDFSAEDYDMVMRISENYRIGRIYDPIYEVIRHSGGTDHAIDQVVIDRNDEAKDHMRLEAIQRRKKLNQ